MPPPNLPPRPPEYSPALPPRPPTAKDRNLPRLITYYQTHHDRTGKPISVLPLLTKPGISLTHLILAAIHINTDPNGLTLNDHPPGHPRYQTLWAEMRVLQASGIKVMGMLGGAAKGSYERLDGSDSQFETYYGPLRQMILERGLDGLDLDVEEEMSLGGVMRLIDRLREDFGPDFIITLAPVAAAMLDSTKNLSGFDYEALEVMRGKQIAWYNTQFYCGWGDCSNPLMYELMLGKGWPPEKIVIGLVTNPDNGSGYVPWPALEVVLKLLRSRHPNFGGIMGWEYFNSLPGGRDRPWIWAKSLTGLIRDEYASSLPLKLPEEIMSPPVAVVVDESVVDGPEGHAADMPVPREFEYYSDSTDED